MRNQRFFQFFSEYSWGRTIRSLFGDGMLSSLLELAGPYAILSGILMFLCIIFASAFKRKYHTAAGVLAYLSGVVSIIMAIAWRVRWDLGIGYTVTTKLILWVPVVLVAIVVLCMLHMVRKATRDEAFLAQKEARRAQMEAERLRSARPVDGADTFTPAVVPIHPVQGGTDEYAVEKIRALYDLLKRGFITQEDFDQKKQELMKRL